MLNIIAIESQTTKTKTSMSNFSNHFKKSFVRNLIIAMILGTLFTKGLMGQPVELVTYNIAFDENLYDVPEPSDARFSNGIVYIDPNWTGNEAGTITEPFSTWDHVNIEPNTAYLQKRGTIDTINNKSLSGEIQNIMIGAYGSGNRPKMKLAKISLNGDNCVVRDIFTYTKIELGYFNSYTWIYNCEIDGSTNSDDLLVNFGHHNKIIANHIHNGQKEGIFMKDDNTGGVGNEVAYNHIHDINQSWFPGATQLEADGDGLQVTTNDSLWIHHNIIDRSNSGNKFCIIINDEPNYYDGKTVYALIENNVLFLPKTTNEGGAGIYLGAPHNSIIRNNRIYSKITEDDEYLLSIFCGTKVVKLEVYGNLIVNADADLRMSYDTAIVYNNTFINTKSTFSNYWYYCENNIFPTTNSNLSNSNLFISDYSLETLFSDPSTNDYTLKIGSPAIDGGIETGFSLDMNGVKVPFNGKTDIGAYEYSDNQATTTNNSIKKDFLNINDVLVYPNPAVNNFTISLTEEAYVQIINMLGELAFTGNLQKGENEISSNLTSGSYIIQIRSSNKLTSKYLIIF
jgi:hypothetical protein